MWKDFKIFLKICENLHVFIYSQMEVDQELARIPNCKQENLSTKIGVFVRK